MSDAIFVAMRKQDLPNSSDVLALLKKDGFPVTLDEEWNILEDDGYLPALLKGEEIGCEIFPFDSADEDQTIQRRADHALPGRRCLHRREGGVEAGRERCAGF